MIEPEKSLAKIMNQHLDRRMIMEDIEDNDGAISPVIEEKMKSLDKAIPEEFDNLDEIMDHLDNGAQYCRAQAKKWSSKAHQFEDNYAFINESLKNWMRATEQKTVTGNDSKFTCYEMKSRLVIPDESQLPAKYFEEKVVYVLDKELVRKDFEAGEFVPTVRLEKVIALRRSLNLKEPKKTKQKELKE